MLAPTHSVELPDVAYADDVAPVLSADAAYVQATIIAAGTVAWQVYTLAGFRINFGPQKTAAKVRWAGPHRINARRLVEQHNSQVRLELAGKVQFMDIIQTYKHLGVRTSFTGNMMKEIVTRSAIVSTTARPLRQKLFRNPAISHAAKKNALELMLMSRKAYHTGCWPALTLSGYQKYKSSTLALFKLAIPIVAVDGAPLDTMVYFPRLQMTIQWKPSSTMDTA